LVCFIDLFWEDINGIWGFINRFCEDINRICWDINLAGGDGYIGSLPAESGISFSAIPKEFINQITAGLSTSFGENINRIPSFINRFWPYINQFPRFINQFGHLST
jgi:hypothetical protein